MTASPRRVTLPPVSGGPGASTRGRYMKDYLGAVRRLPPTKQLAVLANLEELVERIEAASSLEWMPVTVNLTLTDAVYRALGDTEGDLFFTNWIKRQMNAPPFAGLVRTGLNLFGFDTEALARWIPKAFDLMYRDYGEFKIERVGEGPLKVELCAMPHELVHHPNWQRSVGCGLAALFFLTGVKGNVKLDGFDARRGAMRFALRWAT
jgi:hypothetical protein